MYKYCVINCAKVLIKTLGLSIIIWMKRKVSLPLVHISTDFFFPSTYFQWAWVGKSLIIFSSRKNIETHFMCVFTLLLWQLLTHYRIISFLMFIVYSFALFQSCLSSKYIMFCDMFVLPIFRFGSLWLKKETWLVLNSAAATWAHSTIKSRNTSVDYC